MLLAKINYGNENTVFLFKNRDQINKKVFPKGYKVFEILELKIHGKTYKEKKDALIDIAKQYSYLVCDWYCSYSEICMIDNWFEKYGKRYGLLKEFKENGII